MEPSLCLNWPQRSLPDYTQKTTGRILLFFFALSMLSSYGQTNYTRWSFETGDRILSNPILDYSLVIFGSNDHTLYAIHTGTSEVRWRYETGHTVQSSALVNNGAVYFESGNNCYALDKGTGTEIWQFTSGDPDGAEKLDPWDYHHPAPVWDDTIVYFPCGNGRIYGFDPEDGALLFQYDAQDSSAIRSTPVIENGILYVGHWDGSIVAFDLAMNEILWNINTYTPPPPYGTFGMVNTNMIIHKDLLIFGARKPQLQAINKNNGSIAWEYTVPGGGWISGDPLVHNDTLYIGGSDCNKFFAFDVNTGELYWTYTFLFNNFSKPMIVNEYILFTTGNAYAYQGANYGTGYLYALNRTDGTIHNFFQVGGNLFTTPALQGGSIFLGTSDKFLYAIDSTQFMDPVTTVHSQGYQSFAEPTLTPNPFTDTLTLTYVLKRKAPIHIRVVNMNGEFIGELFRGEQDKGPYTLQWDGHDLNHQVVPAGVYFLEMVSNNYKTSKPLIRK